MKYNMNIPDDILLAIGLFIMMMLLSITAVIL